MLRRFKRGLLCTCKGKNHCAVCNRLKASCRYMLLNRIKQDQDFQAELQYNFYYSIPSSWTLIEEASKYTVPYSRVSKRKGRAIYKGGKSYRMMFPQMKKALGVM